MTLSLRGGAVKLTLDFDPTTHSNGHTATTGERNLHRTVSFTSPSRFSLRPMRPSADGDN